MVSVGVKKISGYLSEVDCPHFVPNNKTKKALYEYGPRIHDEIVEKTIEYLKSKYPKIKCLKEYFIEKPLNEKSLKGSIDMLCIDDSSKNLFIVEAKSYGLHKLNLRDYYQLHFYFEALKEKYKDYKINRILVYNYGKKGIIIVNINIHEEDFIIPNIIDEEKYIMPSIWCKECGRISCPFHGRNYLG